MDESRVEKDAKVKFLVMSEYSFMNFLKRQFTLKIKHLLHTPLQNCMTYSVERSKCLRTV